jgi:CheY-like chemotaxis protein
LSAQIISKRLIEAMGGTIRVESTLTKGTEFVICLPVVAKREASVASAPIMLPSTSPSAPPSSVRLVAAAAADAPKGETGAPAPHSRRTKADREARRRARRGGEEGASSSQPSLPQVLVVDDDAMTREFLCKAVRRAFPVACLADGAELVRVLLAGLHAPVDEDLGTDVSAGAEALQVLFAEHSALPAVVVLDGNMPVLGGRDTLKCIRRLESSLTPPQRERLREVKFIGLSGDVEEGEGMLALGASVALCKPVEGASLLEAIQTLVKERSREHVD